MTAKNRAGLITKLQTSLKKHYKPAPAAPGRPLMEHFLYAALLEDAPVDIADEGFAKCEQEFFDWNEVRVTSVTELAEVLSHFPSPAMTALRLKRCLQSVFESFYSFEIDHLKKENLGKAVAKFEAMNGVTPFVLSYLIQHGLGGHAIPVNTSGIWIMFKTGVVSEAEAKTGKVPGLERAIPKSKAIEFSSMLHQAAVALAADPKSKQVWEVIWAVNKDAEMTAPETVSTKSAKRKAGPPPAEAPSDDKSKVKSTGKAAAASKSITPESESKDKTKPAPAKSASKAKSAGDVAKATDEAAKPVQPAEGTTIETASKSKSKSAAAEKAPPSDTKKTKATKSPAESKSPAELKKPAESKKPTEASKPSDTKEVAAKPATSTKGVKSSSQSVKESAKDVAATPPKKSTSTKTPPPALEKVPPSESKPVKEVSKKSDAKKPKEEVPAAGAGNQKLTKRKPR